MIYDSDTVGNIPAVFIRFSSFFLVTFGKKLYDSKKSKMN